MYNFINHGNRAQLRMEVIGFTAVTNQTAYEGTIVTDQEITPGPLCNPIVHKIR